MNQARTCEARAGLGGLAIGAVLLPVLTSAPALAQCETKALRTANVAQVIDGQTLRLEGGGGVRLVGALAPETPRWWKGAKPWPPAQRARGALEALVGSGKVELRFAAREAEQDRHGRFLAQLFVLRGAAWIWVQGDMIRRGMAQAYSFKGHRACARDLQGAEREAREGRAGLWRSGTFTIQSADAVDALSKRRGAFQIVEGQVLSVGRTRGWTFLNFGPDWHTDFTIAIRAADRRAFQGLEAPLDQLAGRRVRVRGWVEYWNGPVIKATHREQITILDESASVAP